jgi:hypothetical protein
LTPAGNHYALITLDYLTDWVEAFPMVDQSSETIARLFMDGHIRRHGSPRTILTDGSPALTEGIMAEIYAAYCIHQTATIPDEPVVSDRIRYVDQRLQDRMDALASKHPHCWDDLLPQALIEDRRQRLWNKEREENSRLADAARAPTDRELRPASQQSEASGSEQ